MKDPNENRPRYRKTKVGWIPDEWKMEALGTITDIILSGVDKKTVHGEERVFLCNYTDVYYNKHIDSSIDFMIATATSREKKRFALHFKDVLVTKDSETPDDIAVPAYVSEELQDILCGYHLAILRSEPVKLSSKYLCKLLESHAIRHYFYTLANGVTRFGLSAGAIAKAQIPLPPLPEQQKIAEILSTWDEAIEQTRKLVEAKKRRKKALMQQLLTGKKRLPGFKAEWTEQKLGSVFTERNETGREDLPLLAITGSRGVIPADEIDRKDSSSADKSRYKRIAVGDIGYNTMRMWQGVNALSSLEGIVSPAYTICIPSDKLCGAFLSYYFKSQPVIHQFYRYSQGLVSDTWNLKFHHFAQISLPFPEKDEQEALGSVLKATDEETNSHKAELEALEKQKRGLMQKLLTGTVRVKV